MSTVLGTRFISIVTPNDNDETTNLAFSCDSLYESSIIASIFGKISSRQEKSINMSLLY